MSDAKPQICCPNPHCAAPLNTLGNLVCNACQTPLIYRYLWAVGQPPGAFPAGTQVAGRYYVSAPQIWLDTQPGLPPDMSVNWSTDVLPYLHLYPQRLHVPEVYGFCPEHGDAQTSAIFLLENVPIDEKGNLKAAIAQAWSQATATRQLYWLWQLLQLWTPLLEQGVASSLLAAANIRVEGWRVRLCQLFNDADVLATAETRELEPAAAPGLADLANRWLEWMSTAQPEVAAPLQTLCHQMQTEGVELSAIAAQLNQLLMIQAAQLPLRVQVAGATDTGPQRSHNEDTCYPLTLKPESLASCLAIVCDGIGGHEGGEVASQTAVRSLQLQAQALLAEIAEQTELVSPDLLVQQLEASVRVVNNLIASQNDTQGRQERRRMGTTLVMALHVPQRLRTADGAVPNSGHELYLVNVGDSRAYWITPHYCHCLTVDDDVAVREVRLGRSLYREALQRPDAGALTQALGTRDADFLRPTVQRFILEEDGILLLCSDGLSDNDLVERSWTDYTDTILKGQHALELAAKTWVELANQKNGHDNTSVVLLRCNVSGLSSEPSLPLAVSGSGSAWSPASRALLEDEPETAAQAESTTILKDKRSRRLKALAVLLILLLLGSGIGLLVWSRLNPQGFQQFRERVLPRM